jgi:hypothetical protein
MKHTTIAILLLSGLLTQTNAQQPFAVIELFTSQGCSSCPPADRLLSQTIAEANKDGRKIIALSFHVDYWNRLGWADPFSNKKYSQRQSEYVAGMKLRSAYTPQMVVNGVHEFVGSSSGDLKAALEGSLATSPSAGFKSLAASVKKGSAPQLKYKLEGDYAGCKIHFALVSFSEATLVERGENGGRELKNENVVRQFITVPASASGTLNFEKLPMPNVGNMAIVGYIQHDDLRIIGAAFAELDVQ